MKIRQITYYTEDGKRHDLEFKNNQPTTATLLELIVKGY